MQRENGHGGWKLRKLCGIFSSAMSLRSITATVEELAGTLAMQNLEQNVPRTDWD
jgi:hypothetical protein